MDSIDIIIEVVKRLTGKTKEKTPNVTINKFIVKDLEKSDHEGASAFESPKSIKAEKFI